MAKLHHGADGMATCGWIAVPTTEQTGKVTCKLCIRQVQKRRDWTRAVTMEEAIRDLAHLIAGPVMIHYPELTPQTWRTMRCRQGLTCHCEFCVADEVNESTREAWEASQQLRPHRLYEYPFGGARAALSLLLRWVQDGPAARSSHGSAQARAQETALLGTQVQTTHRFDREPIELRRATQAHDIMRACEWAFSEEQQRRGLTRAQAIAILLDSVDPDGRGPEAWAEATGLSERAVKALIGHGTRAVTLWLHRNGYTPEPRRR